MSSTNNVVSSNTPCMSPRMNEMKGSNVLIISAFSLATPNGEVLFVLDIRCRLDAKGHFLGLINAVAGHTGFDASLSAE